MRRAIVAMFLFCIFSSLAPAAQLPELKTVSDVDPIQFQGRWYEIALIPHWVERGCSDTTTTYLLEADGRIEIINECLKFGKSRRAKMVSWHVGSGRDGKYKVRYIWPFSGTYWVIALEPGYQWAVVGSPSRRYLWILSRTPTMPAQRYAELIQFAAQQGYDAARIQPTFQGAR